MSIHFPHVIDPRSSKSTSQSKTHSIFENEDEDDEQSKKIVINVANGATFEEISRQTEQMQAAKMKPDVIKPQENKSIFISRSALINRSDHIHPPLDINTTEASETIILASNNDNRDVPPESLPDEPTMDDYLSTEAVSIENFGLALLRGQGWAPGKGIGLTNNQVVEEMDYQFGNAGTTGLGADSSSKLKSTLKQLEKEGKSLTDLNTRKDPHADGLQKSKGSGADNVDTKSTSSKTTTIAAAAGNTASSTTRATSHSGQERDTDRDRDRDRSRNYTNDIAPPPKISSQTTDSSIHPQYRRSFPSSRDWIRERLYVKIVDDTHKYYKHKGVVDRISQNNGDIIIRISKGSSIPSRDPHRGDIETRVKSSRHLETVIPSVDDQDAVVLMLAGPYRGCSGYLTSQRHNTATVQVKIAPGKTITVDNISLDDICQYI